MFIINCKNYEEVAGEKIVKFVNIAEEVSKKYKVKIAIAPPQHLIAKVSHSRLTILAQHTDDKKVGSTTGYVVPEMLKSSGVNGSIINHSEHRISTPEIKNIVQKLRQLKMLSILCVKDVPEARRLSRLNPDYIAIEPPELIGSGRAISTERPELIEHAAKAVKDTKLLCGAGILTGDDVKKAIDLGSKGILVASGIIKAKNWKRIMGDFANAMTSA